MKIIPTMALLGCGAAAVLLGLFGKWSITKDAVSPNHSAAYAVDPLYDAGSIAGGEHLSHEFEVKNTSSQITFLRLGPASCGCTVASLNNNVLKPNQSVNVKLNVDTTNRHGQFEVGVPVMVYYDPEVRKRQGIIALTIRAQVNNSLGFVPSPIQFGELREGTGPATRPFSIMLPNDGSTINDVRLDQPLDFVKVALSGASRRVGDKIVYDGIATVNPDLSKGRQNYSTFVNADVMGVHDQKVLQDQLYGWFVGHFNAEPKILFWDSIHNATQETIRFDALDNGAIDIDDVHCRDRDALHWRIEGNGSDRPSLVVMRPNGKDAVSRTELTIKLREPASQKTTIVTIPALALQ